MSELNRKQMLLQYKKDVNCIRQRAKAQNLTDHEINEIFENCFKLLRTQHDYSSNPKCRRILLLISKLALFITILIIVTYILLNVHQPTSSIVLRNVQGLIYPGLKFLRFLAVPILKQFPSLTYLYDETCLAENPYFYVSDMECWPCETVHAVMDLTGFDNHSLYQSGIPYIVKTNQKHITIKDLHHMYINNQNVFNIDANSIRSTNTSIMSLETFFKHASNNKESSKVHTLWRINRMAPARIIRNLFPKPYFVSKRSGQSMERYIMVDEILAEAYTLPNFECSYVFLVQGAGERTIILKPSKECENNCRTVSIVLKPSFVLWYNWWYWRPISLPSDNASETSIAYISCYF